MVKPRRGGSSSRTQFHRVYVLLYVKMAAFLLPLQWNCGLIALGGSCVYSVYMLLPLLEFADLVKVAGNLNGKAANELTASFAFSMSVDSFISTPLLFSMQQLKL